MSRRVHAKGNNHEAPSPTIGQRWNRDGRQKIKPMESHDPMTWRFIAASIIIPLAVVGVVCSYLGRL